jgi:RNA recognition motif-containing protein
VLHPRASTTLVVNGLEPHVAESHLLYVLQMLAVVKELRMPKERAASGGCNRGFAFVDLHSVEDATRVQQALDGSAMEAEAYTRPLLSST